MKKELLNTPNNIIKGKIEIDSQINKLYYRILYNIQKENRKYIIKSKKGEKLTEEQAIILQELDRIGYLKCTVSYDEIKSIIKRRNDQMKDEVLKRFVALQTAVFRFATGEENNEETQTQLVGEVSVSDIGYSVSLSAKLYRYLFYSVGVGFTPVNLVVLFNLKSQYSQALYVTLRSWTGVKREIEYSIEELRSIFKVGSKYGAYKNFKQKTISAAINEINATGAMNIVEVKEIKKGRSVESVIFVVEDLEPRFVLDENKEDIEDEFVIWLDYIKLESEALKERLELKYADMNLDSPIVRTLFHKAYDKTLNKDNSFTMIQDKKGRTNFALFNFIVNGEILTNELSLENQF